MLQRRCFAAYSVESIDQALSVGTRTRTRPLRSTKSVRKTSREGKAGRYGGRPLGRTEEAIERVRSEQKRKRVKECEGGRNGSMRILGDGWTRPRAIKNDNELPGRERSKIQRMRE